jgi:GTPase SAR1 family protein
MGLCGSVDADGRATNARLQKELDNYAAQMEDKIRLLLLGAGESGKSTIFKQMRIIYGSGFTQSDRQMYITAIHNNTISCMKAICEHIQEEDGVRAVAELKVLDEASETDPLTEELGAIISTLWGDSGVQKAWNRRSEYQVIESNAEYFKKIDEISAFGYVPDDADILLSRVRTTGIVEESYEIEGSTFVIIDVGGQRNERKKWIHCFEDVNAIIYVAALSEYDQVLFEDKKQNRMVEALTLFGEMCNSPWFERTDMILFLNKCDLFQDKIMKVKINSVPEFEEYEIPPQDYDSGVQFFLEEFMKRNHKEKDIFFHVTCATDSSNVKVVFDACRDIILKKNLEVSVSRPHTVCL